MRDLARGVPPVVRINDAICTKRFAGMKQHALQVLGSGLGWTDVNDVLWHAVELILSPLK
jgi:hypothetical protein